MGKSKSVITLLTVMLCFVLSGLQSIFAQETKSEEFTLEEITVTAEKRTENLQKTPIAMAVIQGDQLLNTGAVSIDDILKDIPNVSTSATGGMGSTINIRGLGQDMPIGVGDSSVSTNYDGTFEGRPEVGLFGYFDVDRVEVLKGPQGTLYGRNATGGVVNVVSVKPKIDKVEGYAAIESADYGRLKTEGAVNAPISETFAGRVSFVSLKENSVLKDDHGLRMSQNGMATRLQLRYTPSSDVSIGLLYNYIHRDGALPNVVTAANWNAGIHDIYNTANDVYPYTNTRKSSFNDSKVSVNAEFPLAVGIVTLVPSYERVTARNSQYDFPGGPITPASVPAFSVGGNPWGSFTKTVEGRYSSKSDSAVKWVGGLYWTSTDEPGASSSATSKTYSTKAVFAQTTYPVADTFRVILGARYDNDKKGYSNDTFETQVPPRPNQKEFTFNYFDWKAGVETDISKDVMAYFTLSTGHKPGGFNENTGDPFDEESDVSAELGIKSRFLDNRVQLNGAAFYYDYKGYQAINFANVFHPSTGLTFPDAVFINAPGARNLGAEVDTTALIGDATVFSLNLAYLDNKYNKTFLVNPTLGETVDNNGKPMPHSPKFSLKTSIDYTFTFSDNSTLKPRASYRWTDKQYASFIVIPANIAPAYSVVDASLNYTSSKNWYINLYVNNALNKHYYTGSAQAGPELRYFVADPLKMGAVFNIKF
jgi:iron complex outermembrane recepter protein